MAQIPSKVLDIAMGFDQNKITHQFEPMAYGGSLH